MRFLDEEHSATFDKICAKMKRSDEYHLAVALSSAKVSKKVGKLAHL